MVEEKNRNKKDTKIDWPALDEYWAKEYEEDYIPIK